MMTSDCGHPCIIEMGVSTQICNVAAIDSYSCLGIYGVVLVCNDIKVPLTVSFISFF